MDISAGVRVGGGLEDGFFCPTTLFILTISVLSDCGSECANQNTLQGRTYCLPQLLASSCQLFQGPPQLQRASLPRACPSRDVRSSHFSPMKDMQRGRIHFTKLTSSARPALQLNFSLRPVLLMSGSSTQEVIPSKHLAP